MGDGQNLSSFLHKKCLLIIDEAQEMEISVYNGKERCPCKISISDIIQKEHSLVFISSSNQNFSNHFKHKNFSTLKLKDAKELIKKKCSNGYKELANDTLKKVGANPHYIDQIFAFNISYCEATNEEKDFSTSQGLQKVYNFEVLHPKGEIYYFCQMHPRKNQTGLKRNPKGKKGFVLQKMHKNT